MPLCIALTKSFHESKQMQNITPITAKMVLVLIARVNILIGGLVVASGTVLLMLFLRIRLQMTSDYYEASAERQ